MKKLNIHSIILSILLLYSLPSSALKSVKEGEATFYTTVSNGRLHLSDPGTSQTYGIITNGKSTLGKFNMEGVFNYSYSNMNNKAYQMLYTPDSHIFYYADTVRADHKQEEFNLTATTELNSFKIKPFISVSLQIGSLSKQRDIRNKNSLNDLCLTGGFVFSPSDSSNFNLKLGYTFSNINQESDLTRLGPDIILPVIQNEGLFFGPTQNYNTSFFHNIYYNTNKHKFLLNINNKHSRVNIGYHWLKTTIQTRTHNQQMGKEKGFGANISVENYNILHIEGFNTTCTANINKLYFYSPVGQLISGSGQYLWEYYSSIKRHISTKADASVIINYPIGNFNITPSYTFSYNTETHLIYPQKYSQNFNSNIIALNSSYNLTLPEHIFAYSFKIFYTHKFVNSKMLTLEDTEVGFQKYDRNENLLLQDYEYKSQKINTYGFSIKLTPVRIQRLNISADCSVCNGSYSRQINSILNISYRL